MTKHHLSRLGLIGLLLAVPSGAAWEAPEAVSPASPSGTAVLSDSCPTFLWGGVEEAAAFELAIYEVSEAGEPEIVMQKRLPGSAQGWQPSLEECLEPGGHYAWSLRAVGAEGASEWSDVNFFDVSTAPSLEQVQDALAVLQRYLNQSDRHAGSQNPDESPATLGPSASPARAGREPSGLPEAAEAPLPAAAPTLGSPALNLDGNLHLEYGSNIFRAGNSFLWADSSNTGVGQSALGPSRGLRGSREDSNRQFVDPQRHLPGGRGEGGLHGNHGRDSPACGQSHQRRGECVESCRPDRELLVTLESGCSCARSHA